MSLAAIMQSVQTNAELVVVTEIEVTTVTVCEASPAATTASLSLDSGASSPAALAENAYSYTVSSTKKNDAESSVELVSAETSHTFTATTPAPAAPETTSTSSTSTEAAETTSPVNKSIFDTTVHTGIATYYSVGVGNCGKKNTDDEFVCAISKRMYDTVADSYSVSQYCGHMINVSHGGKTIQVKVVDSCPECDDGHLDLSPSAFKSLADPVLGIIDIEWTWA